MGAILVDTDKVLSILQSAKAEITVEVVNEPLAHRYNVELYNHLTEAVFIHCR